MNSDVAEQREDRHNENSTRHAKHPAQCTCEDGHGQQPKFASWHHVSCPIADAMIFSAIS